jgi:SAM-dependent methyltransferase
MGNNFQDYSRYYDLLYKDKDYHGETEYVNRLIRKYAPHAESILELGSGTGKHARLLAEKGYRVHGIERSAEMVRVANETAVKNVQFDVGNIDSFALPGKFNVAVSLFHVISYLTTNEELTAAFQNIAGHLEAGGIFIFDVWYSPAVYFQQPETRIKRLSSDEINITRLAEPVNHLRRNVVDVNYEVIIENREYKTFTTLKEKHPMRHFSEPEISLLALHTGFDFIHAEEFLTGKIPGADTWGVCFILQKH